MGIKLLFIESGKDFSRIEKKHIQALAKKAYADAAKILNIQTTVNVTLYRFGAKRTGFTQAKDWIALTLPKGKIDYRQLESTLYHELHHVARGYAGYLEKGEHYILNSIFSEGLATAFEMEKVPRHKHKVVYGSYTKGFVKKWLPQMQPEFFDTKNYRYQEWFHGKGKPNHVGYKIGVYLVNEIQKRNPDLTAGDLVRKPARELLKLSRVVI